MFLLDATKHINVYKIFSDFKELHSLDEFLVSDNIADNNIEAGFFSESYTGIIKYDHNEYNFYAYKFNSTQDSKRYFSKCSGKSTNRTQDFYFSATLSRVSLLVLKDEKCYFVTGFSGVKNFNSFHKYLNEIFTDEISIEK